MKLTTSERHELAGKLLNSLEGLTLTDAKAVLAICGGTLGSEFEANERQCNRAEIEDDLAKARAFPLGSGMPPKRVTS